MKYLLRTTDHGEIGGFTASVSLDGGKSWKPVPGRYVGGGLVNFDNKPQAFDAARRFARRVYSQMMCDAL